MSRPGTLLYQDITMAAFPTERATPRQSAYRPRRCWRKDSFEIDLPKRHLDRCSFHFDDFALRSCNVLASGKST